LLQRTISQLARLEQEIILVLRQGQISPRLLSSQNVKTTADLYPSNGPLVGIYSGLKASGNGFSLAVACDMPFLNVDLLRYMVGLAPGFDVVIPRIGGLTEPLHAVYAKSCLGTIEDMMKRGDFVVYKLLEQVKVRYVEESEINSFDPEHLSFFNINTSADLEKAEQIMIREGAVQ